MYRKLIQHYSPLRKYYKMNGCGRRLLHLYTSCLHHIRKQIGEPAKYILPKTDSCESAEKSLSVIDSYLDKITERSFSFKWIRNITFQSNNLKINIETPIKHGKVQIQKIVMPKWMLCPREMFVYHKENERSCDYFP